MPSESRRTLQSNILPPRTFPCKEKCEACLDVAALDDKIATSQGATAELEAERLNLLFNVNHRHDIIINRLPIELFIKILELSLPMPEVVGEYTSRLEVLGPLVFSAVSRRWRDLVCSTPSLWTVVPIYRVGSVPPVIEELMETWINRSGQSLLSIVVTFGRRRTIQPLFIPRIINHCCRRLEYLRIQGSSFVVSQLDFGDSGARNIDTFALGVSGMDAHAGLKLGQGLQPMTLILHCLSFKALVGVHTSRLTRVHLSWLPVDDFMSLLACAPAMAHLSVEGLTRVHPEIKSLIIHQALRHLKISCDPYIIHSILDSLTATFLQHLEFVAWWSNPAEPSSRVLLDGIVDFLQRSSAMLEYLSIQALRFEPFDEAHSSLKRLIGTVGPSIKHLVIGVILRRHLNQPDQPEAPQQLIESIFKEQKPLPFLQSIIFDTVYRIWLHQLKALLISISQFMSANGVRPVLLVMRFGSNPLNAGDDEDDLPDIYRDGTLLLPGAEIAEMLSLREQFDVAIKMLVKGEQGETDVSDKVFSILTRMSREE